MAAAVPGAASLALVPWVIFRLCPPALHETHAAQTLAAERLEAMGPLARREWTMLVIFGLVLALWLTGEWHGVPATTVALLGVSLLLLTGVLDVARPGRGERRVGRVHLVRRPGDHGRRSSNEPACPGRSPARRRLSSAAGSGGGRS